MNQAATVDYFPRLSRSPARWLVAIATVVLVTNLGPAWVITIPDWLVFPIAQVVGDALTWFAREASIGGLAVQEITRGFAQLID